MRDMRDPTKLGEVYLALRKGGTPISEAVVFESSDYTDGGHISNDPAKHHSKTPQNIGDLDTGGAS